jgi:outer membrane lipoprotein-sorting protein
MKTKNFRFLLLPVIFLLFVTTLHAQKANADQILEKMIKISKRVQDYQVSVKIKTNVEFLKIPETVSTLYYKQPDKTRLKSDHFALLPRKFQFFSPLILLKHEHTAFIEREEKYGSYNCYVIKIIPSGENSDIILVTGWVDKEVLVFRKMDITTKNGGTINLMMDYDPAVVKQYPLPSKIVFAFDVSNVNFPKNLNGNFDEPAPRQKKENLTKGTVDMYFSDYKINVGIDDRIFDEKKK